MKEATVESNFGIDKFKEKIYIKYIYKINGSKAELINKMESYDRLITAETYPAREYHENTHAVLSYNETDGIHWEYIPFTPMELREKAYETEKCIEWDGNIMTVDEANDMFLKYDAEGNAKSDELTVLIAAAKAEIRERFPD